VAWGGCVGEQSQGRKPKWSSQVDHPRARLRNPQHAQGSEAHILDVEEKIKKKIRQQCKALVRLTAFADCMVLLLVAASTSAAAAAAATAADRVAYAGLLFAAADLVLAAAVYAAGAADLVLAAAVDAAAAAVDAAAAADLVLTAAAAVGALDRVASAADL
jgi:hypothetical protein